MRGERGPTLRHPKHWHLLASRQMDSTCDLFTTRAWPHLKTGRLIEALCSSKRCEDP